MKKVKHVIVCAIFCIFMTACASEQVSLEQQDNSTAISTIIDENLSDLNSLNENKKSEISKSNNAEKYAEIVLNNESEWLGHYTAYELHGVPMCWFEDLDFDGRLEFVVGGAIWDICGQGNVNYDFYRFTDDDKMVRLLPSSEDTCLMAANLDCNPGLGYISGTVIKNTKTGKCSYVYSSSFFSYLADVFKEMHFGDCTYEEETLMGYSEIDYSDDLPPVQYYGKDGKEITKSELVADLQSMLEDCILCRSEVGTIPFSDSMKEIVYGSDYSDTLSAIVSNCYDTLNKEEKKQALIDSYNAYHFEETNDPPYSFSNMLIYLGVPVTSINQDNNTVLSEEKLKSILQDSIDNLITDWAYYDYDDDGTKEAFAVFGDTTSNGEQLIYAVFFIDHTGEITPVRDEFWGENYTYSDSAENTIDYPC